MKSRTESIRDERERRKEEIRLKVESILGEEDEYVREEMILALDDEEYDAFNEAMDELEEEEDEDFDEENLNESYEESGKARLYEMAQPRHKSVMLTIPIRDNADCNPVVIGFLAKNINGRNESFRCIDMQDRGTPSIGTRIRISGNPDSKESRLAMSNERNEVLKFAQEVAGLYDVGLTQNYNDITDAIVSCYNDFVVDHNVKSSGKLPTDHYFVEWDAVNRCVIPW